MNKITITLAVILAGCLVYIGSLWQRPLFLFEYAEFEQGVKCLLKNGIPHVSDWLNFISIKIFGCNSFSFRIIPALLTLSAGLFIFLAGKKSSFSNVRITGALIFLLTPAVFLAGTSAVHPMYAAAPAITGAYSCFLLSQSRDWKKILWAGTASLSLALLQIEGSLFFWSILLVLQIVYLLRCKFTSAAENFSSPGAFFSLLPFALTAVFCFPHAATGVIQFPGFMHIKLLAAVIGGGFFPWIFFLIPAVRNFQLRFKNICSDDFTFFSLLLTAGTLAGALFSPLSAGLPLVALAGAAVLLGAGIEMEWVENGFHSCNILLYTVAGLFILLAAGIFA